MREGGEGIRREDKERRREKREKEGQVVLADEKKQGNDKERQGEAERKKTDKVRRDGDIT